MEKGDGYRYKNRWRELLKARVSKPEEFAEDEYRPCSHRGNSPVKVGDYSVMAGGEAYMREEDYQKTDVLITLGNHFATPKDLKAQLIPVPWEDLRPPPEDLVDTIKTKVVPLLESGKKVMVCCTGSHGRTGTFLAYMINLLEPNVQDPIDEVRRRHCQKAVETLGQASAIFALRGEPLPDQYSQEFGTGRFWRL